MALSNNISELPYQSGFEFYQKLSACIAPVLLDSNQLDRFDIVAAEPKVILKDPEHTPYELCRLMTDTLDADEDIFPDLPFAGGWIGYLSYDYVRQLESFPKHIAKDIELPELWFGFYDIAIICDHHDKKCYFIHQDKSCPRYEKIKHCLSKEILSSEIFKLDSNFRCDTAKEDYLKQFEKIQDYIHDGYIYQTNLSQRFHANYQGEPLQAYAKLRRYNPAPFSAMMKLDSNHWVASCSPERFIEIQNRFVKTCPIKGTMPRSPDKKQDEINKNSLSNSEKDRAENLMIVDLLRNDLSKNCIPGSVKVPKLFECLSFQNVHHLVSTITSTLCDNTSPLQLLLDAFPGGSITGAPKISAMTISEEIEQKRRSLFCGSILYWSRNNKLDSNIVIRSCVFDESKVYLWAGGGIVYDSDAEKEYQEIFHKVGNIIEILEGKR